MPVKSAAAVSRKPAADKTAKAGVAKAPAKTAPKAPAKSPVATAKPKPAAKPAAAPAELSEARVVAGLILGTISTAAAKADHGVARIHRRTQRFLRQTYDAVYPLNKIDGLDKPAKIELRDAFLAIFRENAKANDVLGEDGETAGEKALAKVLKRHKL